MELIQLRCFLAVAETLHFGRAARSLDMLPASLGRHVRNLEEVLGLKLVARTTRHVSLTPAGEELLEEAREVILRADRLEHGARNMEVQSTRVLRLGAIDSAAAGLVPHLLTHFRQTRPDIDVTLYEQKTIRLLPRLASGRLDLAFVRPPEVQNPGITFRNLFRETAVVAIPDGHRLAKRESVEIQDLADEPLIVPDRRSRPHSHDLTMKLFIEAGLTARVAQIAEEKQTIVNLVSTGLGLAIVPRWTSRLAVSGVSFVPITVGNGYAMKRLDLAAAWMRGTRDPARDALLDCLNVKLDEIAKSA